MARHECARAQNRTVPTRRVGTVPSWPRGTAVALAVAYAVASVIVLVEREPRVTSYFASSVTAAVLGLAAGVCVVLVGSALTLNGYRGPAGPLALMMGVAWLAPLWAGWENGPAAVRTAASLLAPVMVPLLVNLVALSAHGSLDRRSQPWVAAAYALVGTLVAARTLVHDPERDRYCWVDCGRGANALLVRADTPLARGLGTALLVSVVALAAATLASLARRLVGLTGWSPAVAAAVPATVVLVGEAGYALALLAEPLDRFDGSAGTALFLLRALAILVLSAVLAWASADRLATRARLGLLARDLGDRPAPGDLEAHLARTLRDPDLSVRYWSPRSGRFLDGAGRPVDPGDRDGRATALVLRGGEPVAAVLHDPERVRGRALEGELGAAGRLVIDNERLRAEHLDQLAELRRSRARLVASADEHRRLLERDLHDGAQQRLLAASFELRLARTEANAAADLALAERLDGAVRELAGALTQLREFAHGVFPVVLDQTGLVEALRSLADAATMPVTLDCDLTVRPSLAAERSAYLLIKAAVESATGEDVVRVRLRQDGHYLVVEVAGTGTLDPVPLEDRVGAVGGELQAGPEALRAVIPCESS